MHTTYKYNTTQLCWRSIQHFQHHHIGNRIHSEIVVQCYTVLWCCVGSCYIIYSYIQFLLSTLILKRFEKLKGGISLIMFAICGSPPQVLHRGEGNSRKGIALTTCKLLLIPLCLCLCIQSILSSVSEWMWMCCVEDWEFTIITINHTNKMLILIYIIHTYSHIKLHFMHIITALLSIIIIIIYYIIIYILIM